MRIAVFAIAAFGLTFLPACATREPDENPSRPLSSKSLLECRGDYRGTVVSDYLADDAAKPVTEAEAIQRYVERHPSARGVFRVEDRGERAAIYANRAPDGRAVRVLRLIRGNADDWRVASFEFCS